MSANTKLVSVGGHTLRYRHLLVIAVLAAAVAIAFLIRAQPVQYGFELNEFDPFFNYRATLYMIENGIPAYYEWHDTMSWYPNGRDVSATSQVALHMAAAITYNIFGGGMTVYDYTIIFPAVFGALTAIVLFALVRVIGGTTAGLFAAILYSVSLPILVRSPIGWFKSEPFGLFLSILAVYLFVSGLYSANKGIAATRLITAGLFVSASVSAWGGNQFFIIPVGILFLALPFLRKDHNFLIWAIPLFAISTLATAFLFERGIASTPLASIALVASAGVLIACILVQKKSAIQHKTRNGLIFIGVIIITLSAGAIVSIESGIIANPEYRYINALNPFLTTEIPLVESVSEHATTTLPQSFLFHSVLMIFAGIGIWLIIKALAEKQTKNYIRRDMLAFTLVIGMMGVYISSSYVRLEVFAAISVITMASLGLSMLSKEFFARGRPNMYGIEDNDKHVTNHTQQNDKEIKEENEQAIKNDTIQNHLLPSKTARVKMSAKEQRFSGMHASKSIHNNNNNNNTTSNMKRAISSKFSLPFMAGIVILLLMPLTYSVIGTADVFSLTDAPPTILTGGASFSTPTNDWLDALSWIRNSTPPDSIIASWWDYGYWISTVGERASLADNATLDSIRIEKLADMFIQSPDEAWLILQELEADYILIFVAGQMLTSDSPTPLYTLQNGGDESKKQWFMRIGGHDTNTYLHMDGISGTEYFWENTALAQLFPFSLTTYINPNNPSQQFPTYVPGSIGIYNKDIKYPADGNGPFKLAYSSPSFNAEMVGPMIGIFVYEINDEYKLGEVDDAMFDFTTEEIMQQLEQSLDAQEETQSEDIIPKDAQSNTTQQDNQQSIP